MRRTVFSYLAFVSLLLALGVVAMWGLGRAHTVVVGYGRHVRPGADEWVVVLDGHGAWFGRTRIDLAGPPPRSRGFLLRVLAPGDVADTVGSALAPGDVSAALGFVFANGPIERLSVRSWLAGLRVPNWFLLVALALLPARWAALRRGRWRREELAARGLCPGCGYDLRASPERCPECGSLAPSPLYAGERAGVRGW
jgi:hypothetical protein